MNSHGVCLPVYWMSGNGNQDKENVKQTHGQTSKYCNGRKMKVNTKLNVKVKVKIKGK